jgi:hypothetical protein
LKFVIMPPTIFWHKKEWRPSLPDP